MRILLVNTLFPPQAVGGAELAVAMLAQGLVARGHVVGILSQKPKTSELPAFQDVAGMEIYRWTQKDAWPYDASWAASGAARKLLWHAREDWRRSGSAFLNSVAAVFQPDVVHTHNLSGFGTALWNFTVPVPLIHTLHDYYLLCCRSTEYRSNIRCQRTCLDCTLLTLGRRWRTRRPDAVVAVSRHVLTKHADAGLFQNSRTNVIGHRVSVAGVRRRLVKRVVNFGFLGRLEAAKGLPILARAFSESAASDSRLLVAGAGRVAELATLEASIARDNRITYLGYVPRNELLNQIDVLVVPTQWDEPYGLVAAEARAVGLPVLASRIGGLPEALTGYGRAYYVHRYGSVEAWKKALGEIIAHWRPLEVGGPALTAAADSTDPVKAYEDLYVQECLRIRSNDGTGRRRT